MKITSAELALLAKYSTPGPRYTSYPPATAFSPAFGEADFLGEIRATNAAGARAPLSLYVHVPFCDTLCYFCGCNMLITHDRGKIAEYVQALEREIGHMAALVAPDRPVEQLHWGGGTPTYLRPEEIVRLAGALRSRFRFSETIEAGCEIDPRDLQREHLEALAEAGFNRISMGVQDFDPDTQFAVNRIQPEAMTRAVIGWARALGFESINLDFIYGLPHQTVATFEKTLDAIIDIRADRLAIYNYAHVPWLKKHMGLISEADLPTPETKLAILQMTIERLTAAGYVYIGMDHFALPENELAVALRTRTLYRNFQGYSTKAGCDLYGLGMTAISQFENIYSQAMKTLPAYYEAVREGRLGVHAGYRLTADDRLRREVIMRLMCDFELDKRAIERRWEIRFDDYFAGAYPLLAELVADECVVLGGDRITITDPGRLVIRNIAMAFDAHLARRTEGMYSKTV